MPLLPTQGCLTMLIYKSLVDMSKSSRLCSALDLIKVYMELKWTVSRDFRLLFFFMNQFPPSP
jgi:hypothetical protein